MNKALEAAYLACTYRVFLPGGVVDVRIDAAQPELVRWLAQEGSSTWAILTACNPASERLAPDENAQRQSELECALLEQGFMPYAAENVADDAGWPTEESCFIADIDVKNSVALARRFGQNAIVVGAGDGVARLVWLKEEKDHS